MIRSRAPSPAARPSPTCTARPSTRSRSTAPTLDTFGRYQDNRIQARRPRRPRTSCACTAELPYSHTGEGLHRFVDPADQRVYLYTQFEVPDARRVYTTFEQPDLKSVFTFTVTAPAHWDGHLQRRRRRSPRTSATARACGASRRPSGCRRTSPRSSRVSTTASTTSTTASTAPSRSATSAASRWSSTSTTRRSTRSPSRASRSSRTPSTSPTRSASTTRPTCRSTTWARWRTPGA